MTSARQDVNRIVDAKGRPPVDWGYPNLGGTDYSDRATVSVNAEPGDLMVGLPCELCGAIYAAVVNLERRVPRRCVNEPKVRRS
jgi:hypothetical protein